MTLANNAIRTYGGLFSKHFCPARTLKVTLTNKPYLICRKYTALLESKSTSGSISISNHQRIVTPKNGVTIPYRLLSAGDA